MVSFALLFLLESAEAQLVDRDSAHRALLVERNATGDPEGLPSDPDLNNGTLLPANMTAETPFAWCDYNLQNVADSGASLSLTISAKSGSAAGARIHTAQRYVYSIFSAMIKCPAGNTTGLLPNFYTSSRETAGIKPAQDEIDFEWLGRNKSIVQVNYYVNGSATTLGVGNEKIIELGFDCSKDFHEYQIDWTPLRIKYTSIWDASDVNNGSWSGTANSYVDAPFVFHVSNVSAVKLSAPWNSPRPTTFPISGLHPPGAFPSGPTPATSPKSKAGYLVPVLVLSGVLALVLCALIFRIARRRKGLRGLAEWRPRPRLPAAALGAPAGEEDWLHDWPPAAFRFDRRSLGQRNTPRGSSCEAQNESGDVGTGDGKEDVGLEPYLERTRKEWSGHYLTRLEGENGIWSGFVAIERVVSPQEPSESNESITLRNALPQAISFDHYRAAT
ncbi:glycosyl hydrolases family 16 protein [Klebsormidium nitens]|uniref:Glycosyl hydrolases family 16 protein n=1 Tax=Klebsormidium nitens TaxID=105231 RepID=A0A1Y1HND3_KLENI|nr:glycosyl hydrolases family 16 protein [Klebsormidium nitens]|eukprot:GAQ80144.1 glycosyl hydrolases family 16 protein [Klebsormidium nitens]